MICTTNLLNHLNLKHFKPLNRILLHPTTKDIHAKGNYHINTGLRQGSRPDKATPPLEVDFIARYSVCINVHDQHVLLCTYLQQFLRMAQSEDRFKQLD